MRPYNLRWHGTLTTKNAHEIGNLLTELLHGKFYTFTAVHPTLLPRLNDNCPETVDVRLDVRPSQKLRAVVQVQTHDGHAHLTIQDTYGLAMLDSDTESEVFNHMYKNPYFSFEGNRVTIHHRAPAGNLIVWAYAVEDHSE